MDISFLLNGETLSPEDMTPTETLLDWRRETRGLCGTREGCNEGDFGAGTVMVMDRHGSKALNADSRCEDAPRICEKSIAAAAIDDVQHRNSGQEHFCLERHTARALPQEGGIW